MAIKIGERSLATRRPQDLDAALVAATGCNALEMARILGGYANPGQVATALRPFLPEDAPSTPELAAEIAVCLDDVLPAVRKLYADAPAPAEKEG